MLSPEVALGLFAGLAKRLQPVSSAQTRAGAALNHGSHMAMSMALGLLFMGGGATTFSTDDEAVAALVIALYPKFPRSTTDNRHHHQVGDPHSELHPPGFPHRVKLSAAMLGLKCSGVHFRPEWCADCRCLLRAGIQASVCARDRAALRAHGGRAHADAGRRAPGHHPQAGRQLPAAAAGRRQALSTAALLGFRSAVTPGHDPQAGRWPPAAAASRRQALCAADSEASEPVSPEDGQ